VIAAEALVGYLQSSIGKYARTSLGTKRRDRDLYQSRLDVWPRWFFAKRSIVRLGRWKKRAIQMLNKPMDRIAGISVN